MTQNKVLKIIMSPHKNKQLDGMRQDKYNQLAKDRRPMIDKSVKATPTYYNATRDKKR